MAEIWSGFMFKSRSEVEGASSEERKQEGENATCDTPWFRV